MIYAARKRCQMACKPGSVSAAAEALANDGHSSGAAVAGRLVQPTRTAGAETFPAGEPARHSYLVLLPVGFTLPRLLPAARCALTAPFHPYSASPWRSRAVCFLWHFPWSRLRRALPGTVSPWSPDFPLRHHFQDVAPRKWWRSGHPAIWRTRHRDFGGDSSRRRP